MATDNRANFYTSEETVYGTTDSSPTWDNVRRLEVNPELTKTLLQSEELYADGMRRFSKHGNKAVALSLSNEMSYGSHDHLWESLMQSSFDTPVADLTATDISALASDNSINSAALAFTHSVGDIIEITGFTGTPANNATAIVTAATTGKLTLSGVTLVDDASGESVTVRTYSKMGFGTTRKSFSAIEDQTDLTTDRFFRWTGLEPLSLSLSPGRDALIGMDWSMIGKDQAAPSDSAPAGSTFGSPTTTQPFTTISGAVHIDGSEVARVTSVSLDIASNLEAFFVMFQDTTLRPTSQMYEVSGSWTFYFSDAADYNKFLNETEGGTATIRLEDSAGNKMLLSFPNLKYNGASRTNDGATKVVELQVEALFDTATGTTMTVAKLPAA